MKKWQVCFTRFFVLFISLFLSVGMLTGCGMRKLLGTYRAFVDFGDCISETAQEELRKQGLETLYSLKLSFVLTLSDDQTFTVSIDNEALKNEFHDTMKDTVTTIFKQKWSEAKVSEDQFDLLAKQNGYDNFDGFVEAYIDELNELADSFLIDSGFSGTWAKEKRILKLDGLECEIQKDRSVIMPLNFGDKDVELVFIKE